MALMATAMRLTITDYSFTSAYCVNPQVNHLLVTRTLAPCDNLCQ